MINFLLKMLKFNIFTFRLTKKFSDFYIQDVIKRLSSNKNHPTLGVNIRENGLGLYKHITNRFNIKKNSIILDYGCGSLRLGQHFIKYLNKENYIGLDITDHFYNLGKKRIDIKLLKIKQPIFDIISDESLSIIKRKKIDIIISTGVLMHVPPQDINNYFNNIFTLGNDDTKYFITFLESDITFKLNKLTFIYSSCEISKIIKKHKHEYTIKKMQIHTKHSKQFKKVIWISGISFNKKK